VLDPGDPQARNATYRFNVGYSGEGKRAEPSLTMAARGQQGMVWSRSWSVDDPEAVDLKKQMSFAAARALMCALEAKGSGTPLEASLLKLYVVACSGLYGDDAPHEQLAANYSQIVAQQPRFAPAWQNLAVVRSIMFQEAAEEEGTASPSLRNAALKAIARARQLTPKSGKVLLAEANLASDDWSRQLPLLDRAIALEPDQAMFYVSRSYALQSVGRMRDAIADAEKAVQLDPLSPIPAVARINALMYGGRLTRAKEEIANAYKIWPDYPYLASADLGYSMRYGDPRRGEQLLGKALSSLTDDDKSPVQFVLAAREDPTPAKIKGALDIWRGAMALHPNATTHYLLTLGTFGKFDDAFRLALDPKAKPFVIAQSFFRPDFAPMRRDRRFMAVAAQYGLVRYWRSSGKWPDFCSDEPIDYDCKTEAAKYS
jgi:tetratricopeptide (TPR) repeat protein